jgi:hypothetical protein
MRDWLQPALGTVSTAAAAVLGASIGYWLVRLTGGSLSRRIQDANAMIAFLEKWIAVSRQLGASEESDKFARERLEAVLSSVWSDYESVVSTTESSRTNPLRAALLLYLPKHPRTWIPQIGFYVFALLFAIEVYAGSTQKLTPATEHLPFISLILFLLFRSLAFFSEGRD